MLASLAMAAAMLALQAMVLHQGFADLASMLGSQSCLSSVSLAAAAKAKPWLPRKSNNQRPHASILRRHSYVHQASRFMAGIAHLQPRELGGEVEGAPGKVGLVGHPGQASPPRQR